MKILVQQQLPVMAEYRLMKLMTQAARTSFLLPGRSS